MIGGLLAAALALLSWPDPRASRRARVVPGTGDAGARTAWSNRLPAPYLAGCSALTGTALVSTTLVACLAAVATFLACRAWLIRRDAARTDARLAALGEGLGALAAELRTGRPISVAAEAAAGACGDPESGRWLAAAVRAPGAVPAGAPPPELNEALDRVSAAVTLSARTGCSLGAVISAVEEDLRVRRRHRLELHAATAGPRASALLLAGLPVLGLAMGSGVGADPWRVLTRTGTGQVLLVVGVALELAGVAWSAGLIRRAVR